MSETEQLVLRYVEATFRQYDIVGAVCDTTTAIRAVDQLRQSQIEMDQLLSELSEQPKRALRKTETAAYERQTQLRAGIGRNSIYPDGITDEVRAIIEPAVQEHWRIVGEHADKYSSLLA